MKLNKQLLTFGNILIIMILLSSCQEDVKKEPGKLDVVCTTTMITDLAKAIGGEDISIQGLMGAGVDPHLYKASEGDVTKLVEADIIFYNGLHLEGKLDEVFEKMGRNQKTIALAKCLEESDLIQSELFAGNYDPHIWFSTFNWMKVGRYLCDVLKENDPEHATDYEQRFEIYERELNKLEHISIKKISSISKEKRILVTAHDAFGYFGKQFDFEVVGLQGLSTATEAGVQDVQKLAALIIEKDVKSIFVETSVPIRTIESLQAAVNSKGHKVSIGGSLFSDALGDAGTIEGTYIGMYNHNVKTIVESLR